MGGHPAVAADVRPLGVGSWTKSDSNQAEDVPESNPAGPNQVMTGSTAHRLRPGTATPMSSVINRSGFDAPKTSLAIGGTTNTEGGSAVARHVSPASGATSELVS